MQNTNTDGSGGVIAFFGGVGFFLLILLLVWLVLGLIAGLVAPDDRKWTFFWLTFLLLGPVGILAASVASPRDPRWFAGGIEEVLARPRAKGRERFWCSRCGAQSDLVQVKGSSCWRCGEERFIAAKS